MLSRARILHSYACKDGNGSVDREQGCRDLWRGRSDRAPKPPGDRRSRQALLFGAINQVGREEAGEDNGSPNGDDGRNGAGLRSQLRQSAHYGLFVAEDRTQMRPPCRL